MLSFRASGMTTLTRTIPLITGLPQVLLSVTSSEIYWKKSSHFYVSVLGDGRLRCSGKRITTAGSDPCWLGRLRRHHLILEALTVAANPSERRLWTVKGTT